MSKTPLEIAPPSPRLPWRELGLVYAIAVAFFAYFQFQSPHLIEGDSHFHAKFAELILEQGFILKFPWVSEGLWTRHFTDKEMLFHYLLALFVAPFGTVLGAKLATVALAAAVVTQFYRIVRKLECGGAWLWLTLLLSSGGLFLYRINVARPQVLAVLLTLVVIEALLFKERRKLFWVSLAFPYAYTAGHLPVVLALIAAVAESSVRRQWVGDQVRTALKAVAIGLVVTPYFPHNLVYLWYQNILVLGLNDSSPVAHTMAGELGTLNFRQAIKVSTAVFAAWGLGLVAMGAGWVRVSYRGTALLLFSGAFLFLSFYAKRFMEYGAPVSLLFAAYALGPAMSILWRAAVARWQRAGLAVTLALALTVLAIRSYHDVKPQFHAQLSSASAVSSALAAAAPAGAKVFVCDWDDAPELWFFNSNYSYTVFLDPVFLYAFDPDRWQRWFDVSNGRFSAEESAQIIKGEFGARYGVCSRDFERLRNHIRTVPGARIIFEAGAYYVFELP